MAPDRLTPSQPLPRVPLEVAPPPTEEVDAGLFQSVLHALRENTIAMERIATNYELARAAFDANTAAIRALEARMFSVEEQQKASDRVQNARHQWEEAIHMAIKDLLRRSRDGS